MNRISDLALGGWSVSAVSLCEAGPYLTPTTSSSFDPGNLNLSFRGSLQRPDCIGNGNVANAATGSVFNIAAFNPIPEGPVGNCGVGILEGPGTATIAAGLSKLSVSRNTCGCALKARLQICSIIRTMRHRQRT
jgi:hypothetical protein